MLTEQQKSHIDQWVTNFTINGIKPTAHQTAIKLGLTKSLVVKYFATKN